MRHLGRRRRFGWPDPPAPGEADQAGHDGVGGTCMLVALALRPGRTRLCPSAAGDHRRRRQGAESRPAVSCHRHADGIRRRQAEGPGSARGLCQGGPGHPPVPQPGALRRATARRRQDGVVRQPQSVVLRPGVQGQRAHFAAATADRPGLDRRRADGELRGRLRRHAAGRRDHHRRRAPATQVLAPRPEGGDRHRDLQPRGILGGAWQLPPGQGQILFRQRPAAENPLLPGLPAAIGSDTPERGGHHRCRGQFAGDHDQLRRPAVPGHPRSVVPARLPAAATRRNDDPAKPLPLRGRGILCRRPPRLSRPCGRRGQGSRPDPARRRATTIATPGGAAEHGQRHAAQLPGGRLLCHRVA